jgi:hypothetical protein
MQGTTMCTAVFAPGQAYVALSRERLFNRLRLEKLDCGKLTNKNTANTDALKAMENLQTLAKFNEN